MTDIFRPIESPLRIDASKIGKFFTCPVQYLFVYHSNIEIKDTRWPNTLFGDTCHKVLELNLLDLQQNVSEKEILAKHQERFYITFQELKSKYEAEGCFKKSRGYVEQEFLAISEKYSLLATKFFINHINYKNIVEVKPESKIELPYDYCSEISVVGKLDMTFFFENNDYDIYDLKTTSKHEQYFCVDWNNAIQNLMYEYLTYKQYGRFANTFGFLVVNKNEKIIFAKEKIIIEPENKEKYFQSITKACTAIQKFLSYPSKTQYKYKCKVYDICKWCVYKTHCDAL